MFCDILNACLDLCDGMFLAGRIATLSIEPRSNKCPICITVLAINKHIVVDAEMSIMLFQIFTLFLFHLVQLFVV